MNVVIFLLALAISKKFLYLNEELLVIVSFILVVFSIFAVAGDSIAKFLDAEVLTILTSLRDAFSGAKGSLIVQKKELFAALSVLEVAPAFQLALLDSIQSLSDRLPCQDTVSEAVLFDLAASVLDTQVVDVSDIADETDVDSIVPAEASDFFRVRIPVVPDFFDAGEESGDALLELLVCLNAVAILSDFF